MNDPFCLPSFTELTHIYNRAMCMWKAHAIFKTIEEYEVVTIASVVYHYRAKG